MTAPAAPPRPRPRRRGLLRRLASRLASAAGVLAHFANRRRWFFLPLVLVLLLSGILLAVTSGLSYVAPFVYSIF